MLFQPKIRRYDFRSFAEGRLIEIKERNPVVLYNSALAPLISAFMGISDYLAVGVFCFAGTSWMFGHRTKAIELLIGGSIGYLIVLHAQDIQSFLKGVAGQ